MTGFVSDLESTNNTAEMEPEKKAPEKEIPFDDKRFFKLENWQKWVKDV